MVYDGAVKDQESSASPTPSAAVSEASSAAVSEAVVRARPARPAHDKRLGVRHPLKHRRYRAGGKMMVEPGGVPSALAVEGEEEETSEVEEEEEEETTSAETEMPSGDVEVSSAPAAVVSVMEEMEVEGGEMELSPEGATLGDTELETRPDDDDEEEEVSSLVVAQGERKQEDTPAASVPASEPPVEKLEDKEREEKEKQEKEKERQKERERVDEVGYMSGGWKR